MNEQISLLMKDEDEDIAEGEEEEPLKTPKTLMINQVTIF